MKYKVELTFWSGWDKDGIDFEADIYRNGKEAPLTMLMDTVVGLITDDFPDHVIITLNRKR